MVMQVVCPALKEMGAMVKRTKKIFRDYNVYRDRPFPLKWGTAFAMDDLMKGVRKNNQEALKINKLMPQMTRAEMKNFLKKFRW